MNFRGLVLGLASLTLPVIGPETAVLGSDPEVARLIDQLSEVGDQGLGFQAIAWDEGFMAADVQPEFRGGILGAPRPVTSPVLRELVRKGVMALPDLLDHLSDGRETRLKVGGFMGMWLDEEYEPRRLPPRTFAAGPGPEEAPELGKRRDVRGYTLRVGDLCFVAVGQIVNRHLNAIRYQPSMCLVINSPVQSPALARKVRDDWGGLNAEQHKQSLIKDASKPLYSADPFALTRLWTYYPADAEGLALTLLARPFYQDSVVGDFVYARLVKEKDANRWKPLIEAFRRDHGSPAADAIPFLISWTYWETSSDDDQAFLEERANAWKILATLYPDDDPNELRFLNTASFEEQAALVRAISPFPSRRVDEAVHRLYLAQAREQPASKGERIALDSLARACVLRLFGKGYADVTWPFLRLKANEWRSDVRSMVQISRHAVAKCLPTWIVRPRRAVAAAFEGLDD